LGATGNGHCFAGPGIIRRRPASEAKGEMNMKHLKMLGLFVMAAASLMAFAGSASAAGTFTSPEKVAYFGELHASGKGTFLLKAGFAEITCTESTILGHVEVNNEEEASGKLTKISFTGCGSSTVDTLSVGSLTIKKANTAVFATGSEVTVSTLGTSCVYGGGTGTQLGSATNNGSGAVVLNVKANLPKISGGFLCANPAEWTGTYTVTSPSPSFID
jgi:hypothetical protein